MFRLSFLGQGGEVKVESGKEWENRERERKQWLKSTALGGKNYREGRKTNIRMWGHRTGWPGPTCHVEAMGDMMHPFS